MNLVTVPMTCARWLALLRRLRGAWQAVACALLLGAGLAGPAAAAEGIAVRTVAIDQADDGWQLEAVFDMQINARLEEAVNRGVALYFIVDFEISRPRWYWFDEKPIQQSLVYKISYTPLLRQYRLSVGNNYQNFTRFEEVTRVLSRLRGWHIADKGALKKDQVYQAALRMRLDTAQLPKPLQLNAIASREWTLESEWHRWSLTP
jgi:hypothetical protein